VGGIYLFFPPTKMLGDVSPRPPYNRRPWLYPCYLLTLLYLTWCGWTSAEYTYVAIRPVQTSSQQSVDLADCLSIKNAPGCYLISQAAWFLKPLSEWAISFIWPGDNLKKYAKLQFIHSDNGDWSKTAKIIKVIGQHHIAWMCFEWAGKVRQPTMWKHVTSGSRNLHLIVLARSEAINLPGNVSSIVQFKTIIP